MPGAVLSYRYVAMGQAGSTSRSGPLPSVPERIDPEHGASRDRHFAQQSRDDPAPFSCIGRVLLRFRQGTEDHNRPPPPPNPLYPKQSPIYRASSAQSQPDPPFPPKLRALKLPPHPSSPFERRVRLGIQ